MKEETIIGNCDSNGLFTAKNPYEALVFVGGPTLRYNEFAEAHPPLFCYNENNQLVKGVEGLEVKGPVWQYKCDPDCVYEWDGCLDNSPEGYRAIATTRKVYIALQPTEKATIDTTEGRAVKADAQPVKEVEILTNSEYLNMYGAPDGAYPKPASKEGKGIVGEPHNPQALKSITTFNKMLSYAGKYEISIQFWGKGYTNVFIAKDGIDLHDFGGLDPEKAIEETVKYLDRINPKS